MNRETSRADFARAGCLTSGGLNSPVRASQSALHRRCPRIAMLTIRSRRLAAIDAGSSSR